MAGALPLAGIKIVELGNNVALPYGTWVLARLGAEVIKVERPGSGDDARAWGPPFWHDTAAIFQVLNAGKRSLAVDLQDAAERAGLRRFILAEADAVLQSYRPGVVAKLGLDGPSLRRDKPSLIYCNLGAFGHKGPLKERPGYDALMQAFGGIMSVTGEEGRPPVRVGVSIVDSGTGMWCVIGLLAALQRRAASGEGCIVDASLYETALGWMNVHAGDYHSVGQINRRRGTATRGIAPYQGYECADGFLIIGAANDRLFRALCQALGHPEWGGDPRFLSNAKRYENMAALNQLLGDLMRTRPRAHWQPILDAAGVPNAPIQGIDEVLAHPQTQALGMVQETDDGRLKLMGLPLSFDGERPPAGAGAPALGQHGERLKSR